MKIRFIDRSFNVIVRFLLRSSYLLVFVSDMILINVVFPEYADQSV